MTYAENILETIGNTPLVKMNKLTAEIDALVLAKYETFNPGNSVKDRMALKMLEEAEAKGLIQPGGTIIEGTSGNTGMGLALAAIVKGYKMVCVMSDKQSKEKMDILKAVGSKVVVCPTDVAPDDPQSYYSVAKRMAEETPNSWYVNQYDNLANTKAHYESTGPEIWKQTDGKITHFIVLVLHPVGTGWLVAGSPRGGGIGSRDAAGVPESSQMRGRLLALSLSICMAIEGPKEALHENPSIFTKNDLFC